MLSFNGKTIYLACGVTDMRKQIDGLCAIVDSTFKMDPIGDAIFVFCNRNRDRLKILQWDGNGYWLHMKRLEYCRFKWPSGNQTEAMQLSVEEIELLLGGPGLEQKLQRKII